MNSKLFSLLSELKKEYCAIKMEKLLSTCAESSLVESFFCDEEKAKMYLNGQAEEFYSRLAFCFVQDLNVVPERYFIYWEPFLGLLNTSERIKFLYACKEWLSGGEIDGFLNGLIHKDQGNTDLAHLYFHKWSNYIAQYLLGTCLLEQEYFEEARRHLEIFLEELEITMQSHRFKNEYRLLIPKWSTLDQLAYACTQLGDFDASKNYYERSLEIFSMEEIFHIFNREVVDSSVDAFDMWISCYALSLEKTGHRNHSKSIVEFGLSKRPESIYLTLVLIELEEDVN